MSQQTSQDGFLESMGVEVHLYSRNSCWNRAILSSRFTFIDPYVFSGHRIITYHIFNDAER